MVKRNAAQEANEADPDPLKRPNQCVKLDPGRELRAVGRNFIEEPVAIVVVIEKAAAKFGINIPCDLAAEPSVSLHGDIRADEKIADVRLAGQVIVERRCDDRLLRPKS